MVRARHGLWLASAFGIVQGDRLGLHRHDGLLRELGVQEQHLRQSDDEGAALASWAYVEGYANALGKTAEQLIEHLDLTIKEQCDPT